MKTLSAIVFCLLFGISLSYANQPTPQCTTKNTQSQNQSQMAVAASKSKAKAKATSTAINYSPSSASAISGPSNAYTGDVTQNINVEDAREYPVTPNIQYGELPIYTASERPGYGFGNLKRRLAGRTWFTYGAMCNLASGGSIVGGYKTVNESPCHTGKSRWIHIVYLEQPELYPGVNAPLHDGCRAADINGYAEGQAENYGTTALMVFGQLGKEAMDAGCNVLAISEVEFSNANSVHGWGIGTSGVRATESGVAAGGTGYASGEAGEYARSMIYGVGIVDSRIVYPER
jgi:hypothetical protein